MTSPERRRLRGRATAWLQKLAWYWILLVAVSLVSLALFAVIGTEVAEQQTAVLDDTARRWVLAHQDPSWFKMFLVITWIGSATVMVPLTAAIAAWLWRRAGRVIAAVAVLAPALATGIFVSFKSLFSRVRPPGALRFHEMTYAFPSGHSTTSAAVIVTITYICMRERLMSLRMAVAIGVLGPLLIGVSRIYLDVHWSTDVIGGWAIGLFVAALTIGAYERLRQRAPLVQGSRR